MATAMYLNNTKLTVSLELGSRMKDAVSRSTMTTQLNSIESRNSMKSALIGLLLRVLRLLVVLAVLILFGMIDS
jgi:hypothetical protein